MTDSWRYCTTPESGVYHGGDCGRGSNSPGLSANIQVGIGPTARRCLQQSAETFFGMEAEFRERLINRLARTVESQDRRCRETSQGHKT